MRNFNTPGKIPVCTGTKYTGCNRIIITYFLWIANIPAQELWKVRKLQMPSPKLEDVSIILAAYNALKYSKACLWSIYEYTPPGYKLILVNNGSTDETGEFFDRIPGAYVIHNEKNLGFPGGYNRGMQAASTKYMLLINNDCLVSHNWLNNMLSCALSDRQIGIVGPRSNRVPGRQRLEKEFKDMEEFYAFTAGFNRPDSSKWFPVSRLSGFCYLINREVVKKIGYFDETFGVGTHEDVDYCLRAKQAGFKLYCAGDVFIHHFSHRTFIENNMDLQEIYHYNKYLLNQKWSLYKVKKSK